MTTLPVLFIGHGSPMNAIEKTPYSHALEALAKTLATPQAVLCISAHWETPGTRITAMSHPKTIHDFYGFPPELYQVQYSAPGAPALAAQIQKLLAPRDVQLDQEWGLDHGTWSVLTHLYPQAQVPVLQLSLARDQSPEYHYQLGQALRPLRDQGVLIVGSGNLVHHLGKIIWSKSAPAHPWAQEFDAWIETQLRAKNHAALVHDFLTAPGGRLSVPTLDHYLPFLVTLGASEPTGTVQTIWDGIELGSISMKSLMWEKA